MTEAALPAKSEDPAMLQPDIDAPARHLFDLTGKVAIVTGSSRGIGRSIAMRMAQMGANVVISSRNQDACQIVADEINAAQERAAALAVAASISRRPDLERLVSVADEEFGKIDIVVCNAASNPYYGPMSGIGDEQFEKVLRNNVLANHWLIQLTLPQMKERRDGVIIIVSSVGGLAGSSVLGAYNISKAADMQLARNLAVELGPHGIRTNAIAPGLVKTDFARALWEDPDTASRVEAATPLRRFGTPDDIAGAAVFLSSAAGRYVNGHTLVVDGGMTIADVMM